MTTAVIFQVALIALGVCALVLCVFVLRRSPRPDGPGVNAAPRAWDAEPISHVASLRAGSREPVIVDDGSVSQYRVHPGASQTSEHWNPYAEEQSRVHRVQAARRRPRPHPPGSHHRHVEEAPSGSPDHYAVLGVRPGATTDEIERAYRRYAATIHPDRFFDDPRRKRDAEAKLKQLNAIMQILRDPAKRAAYDASK